MAGHPESERISALMDEPWSDKDAQAHLEGCAECQAEFERLSRIRMALSALPDEEPPAGEWAAIEAALDVRRSQSAAILPLGRRVARRLAVWGPVQAAAALVLFGGGLFAGLQLTAPEDGSSRGAVPAVISSSGDDRALFDGLTQLESLRTPLRQAGFGTDESVPAGQTFPPVGQTSVEAAQSLAQLDGLIKAMRERLEANPRDFLASAYLLEAVETRDRLADELGSSATWTW